MFILTNNNVAFAKGEVIELGRWENDSTMDTYRIKNGDNYQYAIPANFELCEVSAIPEDFESNKYCYTTEDGFTLNPDYRESEEEQKYTLDEAATLLAQEVNA